MLRVVENICLDAHGTQPRGHDAWPLLMAFGRIRPRLAFSSYNFHFVHSFFAHYYADLMRWAT